MRKTLEERIFSSLRRLSVTIPDLEVVNSDGDLLSEVRYVLKTGIRPFDDIVGGGLPLGRVVELYGLENCGKTQLAIRSAVMHQRGEVYERSTSTGGVVKLKKVKKIDTTTLYIDNEQSLQNDRTTVIENERIKCLTMRCETIESIFVTVNKAINDLATVQREVKDVLHTLLVVVDTVGITSSNEEVKADFGVQDYPRTPKKIRQMYRRLQRKIARYSVCLLCINHVNDSYRAKIGQAKKKTWSNIPRDSDYDTPGGRGTKYAATLRVFMTRVPGMRYRLDKSRQFDSGMLTQFTVVKNRLAKPFRIGRLSLVFDWGFHDRLSILETLILLKFVNQRSTGKLDLLFNRAGIEPTTFTADPPSLEDQDDEPAAMAAAARSKKNLYTCLSRAQWLDFYVAHEADIDALWARVIEIIFTAEIDPSGNVINLKLDAQDNEDEGDEDEIDELGFSDTDD